MDNSAEQMNEKLRTLEENPFGVRFDPIETLREALHHADDEIRKRAARLTGSFPTATFIEPLFRLAAEETDLEVRVAALDALGAFLHHGRMADYHREAEADWEIEASDQMAELSPVQFQAIRDFLGELVHQADWPPRLRAEALVHYAVLEPEEAAGIVEQFYRSDEEALQEGAVETIARMQYGTWEKLLLQELNREPYDERKLHAIEAAGVHQIPGAGPALVGILEQSEQKRFRHAAAEALSLIPWKDARQYLEKYAEDHDDTVREFAREGLMRLAHRSEREEDLRGPRGVDRAN